MKRGGKKNSLGAKLSQAVAFGVISTDFWLLVGHKSSGSRLIKYYSAVLQN